MGVRQLEIDAAIETVEAARGIRAIPEPDVKKDPDPIRYIPHRFHAAEEEVLAYYSAAVGVRAQGYEPGGASGGTNPFELLPIERCASGINRIGRYAETIAALEPDHRLTLELVYGRGQHDQTWLEDDLNPKSGRGSFVWIAVRTPVAKAAWRKACPDDPRALTPEIVLQWVTRLGRHASTSSRLKKWVTECESIRSAALRAYGEARGIRTAKARDEKQDRLKASQTARAAILEESLRKREERAATLFRLRMSAAQRGDS